MSNKKVCVKSYIDKDYPVDVESDVPLYLRAQNANTPMPPGPVNGGLYGGPQNDAPWMPKEVIPTTAYFMQHF